MRRITEKLPIKWLQEAWPSTWLMRTTQLWMREGTKPPFPLTINHCSVKEGNTVWERINTRALIKVKVKTVGALYLRRMADVTPGPRL
jgi:hypothetical protein